MQQQNEEDEKAKASSSGRGGTRWSGASKKKGSVTSYARDVQARHQRQAGRERDPAQRATAAARRSQRKQSSEQSSAQSGFGSKGG
jgi:hypothetical protein